MATLSKIYYDNATISNRDGVTTLGGTTEAFVPSQIKKYLDEFKSIRFFGGGTRKEWEGVKKLAEKWIKVAKLLGKELPKLEIGRLAKFENKDFSLVLQKLKIIPIFDLRVIDSGVRGINSIKVPMPMPTSLADFSSKVLDDAVKEMEAGTLGLAKLEADVLKNKGLILGVAGKKLWIYFPLSHETMMDRLTKGNKSSLSKKILGLVYQKIAGRYSIEPIKPPDPVEPYQPYKATWDKNNPPDRKYETTAGNTSTSNLRNNTNTYKDYMTA